MIIPCHVFKKDQDKDRKATVDARKEKKENLGAGGEKCYKKISLRSLEITGLLIHLPLKEANEAARLSFVSQNVNLLQRLGSCPSPFLFPWWPTQSLLWPSTTMMIDFVQFLSIISDDINNNSTAIQLYFNKTQTLKVSGI